MSKLTLHMPSRPKGEPIEVFPYGMIPNGDTIEVEGLDEDTKVGFDFDTPLKEGEWEDLSLVENQNFQAPVMSADSESEPPVKGEDTDAQDPAPEKAPRTRKETS